RSSDNLALCRALRADPSVSRATPILLTTAGPALRAQQIEALRAGAWELRGDPLDLEELVLRLGAYVQGKLEVDRLGSEGLVDRITDAVARTAAVKSRAGTSTAPAGTRPSGGRSSTNLHLPAPPSPTELLDRARLALN